MIITKKNQNIELHEAFEEVDELEQNFKQSEKVQSMNNRSLLSKLVEMKGMCQDAISDLTDLHVNFENDRALHALQASKLSNQIQNVLEVKNRILNDYEAAKQTILQKVSCLFSASCYNSVK